MEVILYSKECNWYTRCCPLNRGIRNRVSINRITCTCVRILCVHVHVVCVCDVI